MIVGFLVLLLLRQTDSLVIKLSVSEFTVTYADYFYAVPAGMLRNNLSIL